MATLPPSSSAPNPCAGCKLHLNCALFQRGVERCGWYNAPVGKLISKMKPSGIAHVGMPKKGKTP